MDGSEAHRQRQWRPPQLADCKAGLFHSLQPIADKTLQRYNKLNDKWIKKIKKIMATKVGIKSKEVRKRTILKKKPVKLPSVINGVKVSEIPESSKERRTLLLERLNRYKGKKIFCPALKDNVYITKASIDEMVHRAGRYTNATIAALNLRTIIKNASYLKTNPAKENRRQKELRLKEMLTLICPIKKYGLAKLTVGKRYSGKLIQYCVTVIKIEWLKEE